MTAALTVPPALAALVRAGADAVAPLLDRLVGRPIDAQLLDLALVPAPHLTRDLARRGREAGASVLQSFDGAVEGLALLWLPRSASLALAACLTGSEAPAEEHDYATESLLAELGSLVIGAVVGRLDEACGLRPAFDVPTVVLDPYAEDLEREFARADIDGRHLLMASLRLEIDDAKVETVLAVGFATDFEDTTGEGGPAA